MNRVVFYFNINDVEHSSLLTKAKISVLDEPLINVVHYLTYL